MNTSTGLLLLAIVATSALYVMAARNDTIFTKRVEGRDFTSINGRLYFFPYNNTYDLSTEDAMKYCNSINMVLVSLETEEEDLAVRQYLVDQGWGAYTYGAFRTSGRKLGSSYMWTSTGKEFNYTAWAGSQPDDPNPDACIDIQGSFGWYDADCSVVDLVLFICEQTDS